MDNVANENNFNKTKQKYGCGYWDICTKRMHFEDITEEDNIKVGLCLVIGKEFDNWEYEYMKKYEPDDELLKENLEYVLKELDNELDNLIEDDYFEDCYDLENYKYQRKDELESECYKSYFHNTDCNGCRVCLNHKTGTEQAINIDLNEYKQINPFDDDIWLD